MKDNQKLSNAFSAENFKKNLTLAGKAIKTKKFWVELLIMTFGMFIGAIAIYFFLIPSKLIVGSITGLSLVLAKLFPIMSVGSMILLINAVLLVLSFILIGNEFGAKTVYTALILGPMIDLCAKLFPMNGSMFAVEVAGQTIANPWFDLLLFVIILSASQSVLFSINASTGGLDILAKIINKYTGLALGTAVTIAGGLICCTAFAINEPSLVLIGLIGTWLNGLILNNFMAGISSKTRVFIISKEYQKIQDFVINEIGRGVTLHEIIGGYTNEKSMQLEILMTRDEFAKLMAYMNKNSIPSFITSDSVNEVHGLWNKKTRIRV